MIAKNNVRDRIKSEVTFASARGYVNLTLSLEDVKALLEEDDSEIRSLEQACAESDKYAERLEQDVEVLRDKATFLENRVKQMKSVFKGFSEAMANFVHLP